MSRTLVSDTRILKEMIFSGVSSRRDLCKKLGLSKAAMTRAVSRLLETNWIEEGSSLDEFRRGRKIISLNVKPNTVYFLGTDLEGSSIRACLLDCDKRIISSSKRKINPSWSVNKVLKHWMEVLDEVIETAQVDTKRIACIGLGLPGQLSRNGELYTRVIFTSGHWINLHADIILKKYNLSAIAANNTFCIAEYERRLGAAQEADNFITIVLRYGIGASIFANGSFINSEEYLISELGHMRIGTSGPLCLCGQAGCLDTLISGRTLIEKNITDEASLRHELSRRAKYLAIGIGNLFKIIRTPLIIIDGIYNEYKYYFQPVFISALNAELQGLALSPPKIVFGDTTDFKASIGAAMMSADKFLEEYFNKNLANNIRT